MANQAAQLDALGDPTRRIIVERLSAGPMAVGELARGFRISRPAISQHLRVLKDARLVTDRPEGNRRIYQLDPRGFETVRDYVDRLWSDALAAFKRNVEEK
jgi:DNA-binding transcriptional ArsR family regulator